MCTSIFITTNDKKHLLARTMDFSYPIDAQPLYLPRDYSWASASDGKKWTNQFGFLGTGADLGEDYFVCDGVNEAGLSVAELYLPGEAVYQEKSNPEKTNLCPHEFITWILGNFSSIDALREAIEDINLVDIAVPILGFVTPLHWIITDINGKSVVIEPTEETLHFKEDPVNVMTNTPQLEWHLENLRNYLDVRPKQYESKEFDHFQATPFSQGTGTSGLPGGYTPPERFVRATFFKEHIEDAKDEDEGVMNALNILAPVTIPKGVVIKTTGETDYSQFISIMCNESKTIYYKDYASNGITKVVMSDELLNNTEVQRFEVAKAPKYN
ncbi:choloylglycine hydrolase family protein [Enterococcus gilvus]|uniref:choloylglycine hydrolase family protein n=1 Tax=Enterococcus gilvus TaxID=160453 RepID=UPI0028D51D27|nr:choloylglycine hydrolase family protein [Enterococcus gilvus]